MYFEARVELGIPTNLENTSSFHWPCDYHTNKTKVGLFVEVQVPTRPFLLNSIAIHPSIHTCAHTSSQWSSRYDQNVFPNFRYWTNWSCSGYFLFSWNVIILGKSQGKLVGGERLALQLALLHPACRVKTINTFFNSPLERENPQVFFSSFYKKVCICCD